MKYWFFLVIACLASAAAFGQVAPGQSAQFVLNDSAPIQGLEVVDVPGSGASLVVTGAPPNFEFTGGAIDPITGELWTVGWPSSATFHISKVSLSGLALVSQTLVANMLLAGATTAMGGVEFDRDGNAFVFDAHKIWQIDRSDHTVTLWADEWGLGYNLTGLAIDRETNTMWSVSTTNLSLFGGLLRQYDLNVGPALGTVLVEPALVGLPQKAAAITHDDHGVLYVAALDGLWSYDTQTGLATGLPIPGIPNEFNSIDHDAVLGQLHLGGGSFGKGTYRLFDPLTQTVQLVNRDHFCFADPITCLVTGDKVTTVRVNDFLHSTQLFPRSASASAGFHLEVAAHGHPGEFGAVALTELNGLPIPPLFPAGSIGLCGLGGNFVLSQPIGSLPGFVTSLGFDTGVLDAATGIWILGGVKTITLMP